MSIEKQTKKIMQNAILNFAKKNKVENKNIQVLIYPSNSDLEPKYKVCKNWKPFMDASFNELLNIKIDFLGREFIAGSFIRNYFNKIMRDNNCSNYQDIHVIAYSSSNEVNECDITLYLFLKMKAIKEISFNDLFADIKQYG